MKKKLIALLLTGCMLVLALAGFTAFAEEEDMAEIVVAWLSFSPLSTDATDAVQEAINQITEKEINTHVNIHWYDPNTYSTQVPMMIQANEKLDMIMYTPVPGSGFPSFQSQNQLMDISELMDEYAPAVKETLGNILDGTSVNGRVYGVASYRDMGSSVYFLMRRDVLNDLGLTEQAQAATKWSDLKAILTEVVEQTDLVGIANVDAGGTVISAQPYFFESDNFSENYSYDGLGDGFNMIYVDQETNQVGCYYFSEAYQAMMQRVNDWYKSGLVYKDSATNNDLGETLIKNGAAFSVCTGAEYGVENAKSIQTGYDIMALKVTESMLSTNSCTKFGFGIPVTATEPEAAVKFLNLMYTNADLENTLAWGVEGRDWVRTENGEATYPEGVTAETALYHTADFLNGNQFITIPWAGAVENFRDEQMASMKASPVSKFMGFSLDTSNVQAELTACFNVGEQYRSGLASGSVDYESTYAEFCTKLKAAGIEKVLAEYQTQLDAWLAAK